MHYLHIPETVWGLPGLELLDKAILATVLAYESNNKRCHMTNKQLAAEFGIGERTVKRSLVKLQEKGLIKSITHRHGQEKTTRCITVTLGQNDPTHGAKMTLPTGQNGPTGRAKMTLNTKTNIKIDTKEDTASPLPLSETSVAKPKNTQKPKISLENYGFSVDERQAVERWVEFRRQLKKPLTQLSLDAQVKKFGKDLSAVIEQSIEHGWQGLFALKADNRSNPQDEAIQAYTKLSAAANKQDRTELNKLCEADPRIVAAIAAQGIKPKTWLLKHLQLDNDFARKADREAFVTAYNSVSEGN
jgi:DNA-binding Lrp family transcriptional regulator